MGEETYVYIAPKNNGIGYVFHTNLQAMKDMDGITFDPNIHLKVPINDWYAAGSAVHFVNGAMVLGPDPQVVLKQEAQARIAEIDKEIAEYEQKLIRPSTYIAEQVLYGNVIDPETDVDAQYFKQYKTHIDVLRIERAEKLVIVNS